MTRDEKAKIIAELKEAFGSSETILIAEFKGLTVKKIEELRNMARKENVKVQVIKNTLAKIALTEANKDGLSISDTNIFLWGEQLPVSKIAAKFEENNDLFKIKFAHIDGEIADVEKIKMLSKLPSRNELIAMLLQVWNAPIQNFTIGLNALKEKKEQIA